MILGPRGHDRVVAKNRLIDVAEAPKLLVDPYSLLFYNLMLDSCDVCSLDPDNPDDLAKFLGFSTFRSTKVINSSLGLLFSL